MNRLTSVDEMTSSTASSVITVPQRTHLTPASPMSKHPGKVFIPSFQYFFISSFLHFFISSFPHSNIISFFYFFIPSFLHFFILSFLSSFVRLFNHRPATDSANVEARNRL